MSDEKILHQDDVEEVIEGVIDVADNDYVHKGTAVIASPTAPGASYIQAEVASLKTAIDAIRAALTASGLTG